eukprot:4016603-Alexandrium_andersonii.AAC.1
MSSTPHALASPLIVVAPRCNPTERVWGAGDAVILGFEAVWYCALLSQCCWGTGCGWVYRCTRMP